MSRWDQEYRSLPEQTRAALNDLVNEIFRQETGFHGKIDPRTQPQFAKKWMEVRDNVLANRQRFGRWLQHVGSRLADFALALPIFRSLDTRPEWIRIAQDEVGEREQPGKLKNPRITEYIRTCTVNFDAKKRQNWENMAEDGIEWCACFVNWCLQQAGIEGLNTAWAPSWERWGRQISGPQQGAIVLFKWSTPSPYKFDHIAFCDEKDGKFFMLGGNQGNGEVSSLALNRSAAKRYCMPPGY